MRDKWDGPIEKVDDFHWRIPKSYRHDLRVDGMIIADEKLIKGILTDKAAEQVANVATLPGIQKYSLAMPDIHWGYGFCIGGVAATDPDQDGVISPGGVGYDINCGVRLIRTDLHENDVRPKLEKLVAQLFRDVPCGVGKGGFSSFSKKELQKIVTNGPGWVIKQGYGEPEDIDYTEAKGCLEGADPDVISDRAYERGKKQCGSLGSGNHFMEIQVVDQIFLPNEAGVMGLEKGQICVMIHSGSRGFGYQVCDDYLREFAHVPAKYGIHLPDRQLACAPIRSPEGRRYLGAMRGAANYAWSNRQLLTHAMRQVFERVFDAPPRRLGMQVVYDVAHNIAKMEPYEVNGKTRELCVHRKGATRAFPPNHPELPDKYKPIGQPVLIPGDMGRCSYVLVGREEAMRSTFGSSCHGAGRRMSRKAAIRAAKGRSIRNELLERGVVAMARGRTGLDEEQPDAYKDVTDVVNVVDGAGISKRVCKMRPIGVIKG